MWIAAVKHFIGDVTGIPHPLLHLTIGLFIFWVVCYATKNIWLSVGTLLALELINEANDILPMYLANRHHQPYYTGWAENIDDLIWTMAAPVFIALAVTAARSRKRRLRSRLNV
jgi:hypothetical protein